MARSWSLELPRRPGNWVGCMVNRRLDLPPARPGALFENIRRVADHGELQMVVWGWRGGEDAVVCTGLNIVIVQGQFFVLLNTSKPGSESGPSAPKQAKSPFQRPGQRSHHPNQNKLTPHPIDKYRNPNQRTTSLNNLQPIHSPTQNKPNSKQAQLNEPTARHPTGATWCGLATVDLGTRGDGLPGLWRRSGDAHRAVTAVNTLHFHQRSLLVGLTAEAYEPITTGLARHGRPVGCTYT